MRAVAVILLLPVPLVEDLMFPLLLMENVGPFTVSVKVVVCVSEATVPVTVIVYDPSWVLLLVVIVKVEA